MADMTTVHLVRPMDRKATFINASNRPHLTGAKIPIHFETDQEALANVLASLALSDIAERKWFALPTRYRLS